jgi:hypothetical protein
VKSAALEWALTEPTNPPLRRLPKDIADLLAAVDAPPRLAAHLRAVHDVAWQLTAAISREFATLNFDREAVLFGAATHDIGKTLHVAELSGPGSAHEQAGYDLLVARGVDAPRARFARNHGSWTAEATTDDLLVSLADKIWKAKRVSDLEDHVLHRVCDASGDTRWAAFMHLDDILEGIASGADVRLAFQARHPVGN